MNTASATSSPPPVAPAGSTAGSARVMSVDALRGFDMFWIIGADSLVTALERTRPGPVTGFLKNQLEHAEWAGFHFYDLIFPLFVFIVGVSMVFSLSKALEQSGREAALQRVITRGLLLLVIGVLYSGGFTSPWPDMRLLGVLNRIGLAYLFTGLIFCFFRTRAMAGICAGLLVGYWTLMTFVSFPDIQLEKAALVQRAEAAGDREAAALFKKPGNPSAVKNDPAWAKARAMFDATDARVTGKYEKGYNLANSLDFQYLPGKKYDQFWDPEGLLSTLPAVATCLLGVFAGLLLKSTNFCGKWKTIYLCSFGAGAVILGFLWGLQFPVVKKIWTSSFVLVAGGYSALLLGVFHWVVDVRQWRSWCQPFVWIGANSITIYVANNLIGGGGFRRVAQRFVGGDISAVFDTAFGKGGGEMVISITGIALSVWFCHFLYKRKIFIRL
jgi:predicted acyltransferase